MNWKTNIEINNLRFHIKHGNIGKILKFKIEDFIDKKISGHHSPKSKISKKNKNKKKINNVTC